MYLYRYSSWILHSMWLNMKNEKNSECTLAGIKIKVIKICLPYNYTIWKNNAITSMYMYLFLLGMGQFLQYNGVCLSPYSVFYALRSSISLIYNFKRSSELSFETLKKINCQCEIELLQSLRLHQTKKFTQLKKSIRLLHMLCHQCSNSKKNSWMRYGANYYIKFLSKE